MPYFVFQGQLRATFTGVLKKTDDDYTDHRRDGLMAEQQQRTMSLVLGSFEYPPSYVDEALFTSGGEARAVPLDQAYAPASTEVSYFTMTASFAHALVLDRLRTAAESVAQSALDSRQYDHLEFHYSGFVDPARFLGGRADPCRTGRRLL